MKETPTTGRRKFLGKVVKGAMVLPLAGNIAASIEAFPAGLEEATLIAQTQWPGERKFVPVMLTPYKPDLRIDFEGLSRLIDFYEEGGARGFFANCLSSEMYDLDNAERLALVKHVVRRVNGRMPVVATGSFGDTIEARATYTKKMFDTGVDAVILITSHFADKGEDDTVMMRNLDQYLALTENIPVGTYECPSPYKRMLSPEVLNHLLSTNRFIYHKDTSLDLDKIAAKLAISRDSRLEFYDAHTPNALHALRMGAKGMSCIAGNFYPEVFSWMCNHIEDEKYAEDLQWLQTQLTDTDPLISNGYSLSAKYFLKLRGVSIEINSRKNKRTLTGTQTETLQHIHRQLHGWHERLKIQA